MSVALPFLRSSGIRAQISGLERRRQIDEAANSVPEGVSRGFGGLSDQGLEPYESHFDRIEIGTVGRELQQAALKNPLVFIAHRMFR